MPTVYFSYADVITLRIKGILDQAFKIWETLWH